MSEQATLQRPAPAARPAAPPRAASAPRLFFGTRRDVVASIAFGVALLAAFLPTLIELVENSLRYPEYGHCLLMPPIAAWMIWEQRRRLAALRATRRSLVFAGLAALAFVPFVAFLILGEMKLSWFLKPYAFVGSLTASIALVHGWRGVRALLRPLVVLALMCPIPWRILVWATVPLKRHATVIATGLSDATGLDVSLSGNLIHVPGATSLWVADACSGVRSLISLLAVAVVGCLFWKRHWSIKSLLVASCIPIAVVVNGVRIWMTALLAAKVSPEAAEGFFHVCEGFVLFLFATAALWGWGYLLHRVLPARAAANVAADRSAPDAPVARSRLMPVAFGLALAVLAFGSFGAHRIRARLGTDAGPADPAAIARMEVGFQALPLAVAPFHGEDWVFDEDSIDKSGADAYRSVSYSGPDGRTYQVYIGGALRNADNFHAPNVCMPTAGWEVLAVATVPAPLVDADGHRPHVQRMLMQRGQSQMVVYYWFQAGSRIAASEWQVRMRRLAEILKNESLSPTQIVSIYVPVVDSVDSTNKAGQEFLSIIAPYLRKATAAGGVHG